MLKWFHGSLYSRYIFHHECHTKSGDLLLILSLSQSFVWMSGSVYILPKTPLEHVHVRNTLEEMIGSIEESVGGWKELRHKSIVLNKKKQSFIRRSVKKMIEIIPPLWEQCCISVTSIRFIVENRLFYKHLDVKQKVIHLQISGEPSDQFSQRNLLKKKDTWKSECIPNFAEFYGGILRENLLCWVILANASNICYDQSIFVVHDFLTNQNGCWCGENYGRCTLLFYF